MERVNVTCRLPVEDIAFMDELARINERDRSYYIRKAVSEYVTQQKHQIGAIDRAALQADARLFATEAEVNATFAELSA